MQRRSFYWMSMVLVMLLLAGLACNVGEPTPVVPPILPTITPPPLPPPPPPPPPPTLAATPLPESRAVFSLEGVKSAAIQIEAQGSFVDPQVGLQLNVAGRGSGFIIDESGIAVTNNHVVTGAALLQVWVGGESEPRNARVLGVSECSDLAVIDIEGEGYPYLEWYDGPITPGLDVYAAGFPLGDPEYTLTRGIVSKERADGETDWASVDSVIEHDATINPGNSGGPLVTADGKVVGVNYASAPGYSQYFAIAGERALRIIERLRVGQNVTSIGINGVAVSDEGGVSGIWVSSVESGSPADQAGVLGGDIITMMEGLTLAADGTMADYCDILRSHHPDDTLTIQVLRFDTQEVLEGQLNGVELALSFSFAQELGEDVGGGATSPVYTGYVEVTDNTGAIVMEVPREWDDIDGSVWEDAGEVLGAAIVASSDLDGFNNSYSTPGALFLASELLALLGDPAELLTSFDFSDDCVYEGRYNYEDALYTGVYDLYSDCGGEDNVMVVLAAMPGDQAFATLLVVQAVTEADLEAADHILDTFVVVGDLPDGTSPGGSDDGDGEAATLTVHNLTADSVWYIYISPTDSDSWGADWLGGDVLLAGASYTFDVPAGTYDLAAADPDGAIVAERYDVAIAGDMEWTLYLEDDGADYSALTLFNSSGRNVCYVYISPSTSDSWGDDWLGDDIVADGATYLFSVSTADPLYDLQALDCDDNVLDEAHEVDLRQDTDWNVDFAAPPDGYDPLEFEASWETWPKGTGEIWYIKFTIDAWGGDGKYTYQVSDHTFDTNVFEIEWGCRAAFTGDIIVRSGDGQEVKTTEWIPVPAECH